MLTAYDPADKFCFENIIAEFCGGKTYNLNNQICHYGKAKSYFTDDRDGKKYVYVTIGDQTWMAENLNFATGGKCNNDDPANCDIYGRLYDWDAAMAACHAGWHLPSNAEWTALENLTGGGSVGKYLKADDGWNDYNEQSGNGEDTYGFTALPGGSNMGGFGQIGTYGFWWSTTENNSSNAYRSIISNSSVNRNSVPGDKGYLHSVRCVKGAPLCGGKPYDHATHFCQGGKNVILPLCNGKQYNDMQYCLSNGNINTYKTVTINTQTWLAENLNFAAEGSVCYDNNPANCDIYGRLYDWNTAMAGAASSTANPSGVQGVCPEGWHLPSQAEWNALMAFVHSDNGLASYLSGGGMPNLGGKYLKSETGWSSSGDGEDTYGFSLLPGGRGSSSGSFSEVGSNGNFWSTETVYITGPNTDMGSYMQYGVESVNSYFTNLDFLFSVRCLQD
jgi:uncharacterized protein (TIGR02145 family)